MKEKCSRCGRLLSGVVIVEDNWNVETQKLEEIVVCNECYGKISEREEKERSYFIKHKYLEEK